jgi:transposase
MLLGQVDDKVIGNIEKTVHYYKTTEDNLGIGNALCARALTRKNEMKKAVDDFNEAERAYIRYSKKGKTSEHKSGLMLVIVYRRLIGIISMRQAIADLTKLI